MENVNLYSFWAHSLPQVWVPAQVLNFASDSQLWVHRGLVSVACFDLHVLFLSN